MRRTVCVVSFVAFAGSLAGPALAQAQSNLEADAIAFGVRESVSNMDLSPDGRQAVFVGPGPGRSSVVYMADLVAGTTKPILSTSGAPENVGWCAFVSDRNLVCRYTAIVKDAVLLLPASRTITLDTSGKNIKELGQRASANDYGYRQSDGSIIDWLPGGENSVLMTRVYIPEAGLTGDSNLSRTKQGLGVVRINVGSMSVSPVEPPRINVDRYMSDGRGTVRLMGLVERSAEVNLTGRNKYLYRRAGSRDWKQLVDYQKDEFEPLAIDSTIDALYALRKIDGRYALVTHKLDGSDQETIVATNPRVDMDNVVRSSNGERVIGYTYAEERRHTVYFDPEYEKLATALGKALPKLPSVTFVNTSTDGTKVLLYAGSDNDPGRYYLFDKTKKSLGEVMPARTTLGDRKLANVQSITYRAADGINIPAYLTLPVGKSATGLPAVVLPHGGPSARDEWGFDWLSQFLATRGYAVIQPNYRGSAGFGDAWLAKNGFQGWRTSIGDVTYAARYLTSQGIADPKRLAIVGWSYGGYAALQSAATEPSLYKAVVAIAPVTDLALLKSDYADYTNSLVVNRFVGVGPHISEGSPLRHSGSITAPVLLVHGDLDVNVGVAHSQKMDSALRSAGKSSELLMFKGLDHQLEDSNARALMLSKIGALLDRTIGH